MAIKKFRSIEEMDAARSDLWCDELDEACLKRIAQLWKRSAQISQRTFPKGLFKYRSLEEAQRDEERWLQEHVDRLQRERFGSARIVQRGRES